MENSQKIFELLGSDNISPQIRVADGKKSYKLASLLEKCDFSQALSDSEKEWLDDPKTGLEVI